MSLYSMAQMIPLTVCHNFSRPTLARRPEPSAVTDDADHVLEYDQVMQTKLAIAYALGLDIIHRHRPDPFGGTAIDLACGPGHFSLMMARALRLDALTGVDLSTRMVSVANKNAAQAGLGQVAFEQGDITRLDHIPSNTYDLATFMHAAHHLPTIADVERVMGEMDRITKPRGLVVLMDLVRLNSAWITEWYVDAMGRDYPSLGLTHFLEDFRNSMYAAWSAEEFAHLATQKSRRQWHHLVARGLPTCQILVGLPQAHSTLASRSQLKGLRQLVPSQHRLELAAAQSLAFQTRKLRND